MHGAARLVAQGNRALVVTPIVAHKLWPAQLASFVGIAVPHGRSVGSTARGTARPCTPASSPAEAEVAPLPAAIYDAPQLYDDAFSYRDFDAEAKFLLGAYAQHATSGDGKLRYALELGCGPANHTVQLARRKVNSWALDASPAMLAHAGEKAKAAGTSVTLLHGDMAAFEVPGMEGRFDLIACLLGTLSHMLTNRQAAACFSHVAQHLRPGGVFVVELAHPGDLFDGSLLLQDTGAELWEVDRGGRKLTVVWGTDVDVFDPESQVLQRTVAIHAMDGDDMGECLLEEVAPYRQFTTQEIDLLATAAGLDVVGVYGDLNLDVGLSHEDAYRLVMVMRKGEK